MIYTFFIIDTNKKTCKCKIDSCTAILSGIHAGNCKRHVKKTHPTHYKLYLDDKIDIKTSLMNENDISVISLETIPGQEQQNELQLNTIYKKSNFSLTNIALEMVTKHGCPFSLFDSMCLKKLFAMIDKKYSKDSNNINSKNVKATIVLKTKQLKHNITESLRGKMFFLKVDIASRLNRSIIGINVQRFSLDEKRMKINTLAMKEFSTTHNSENIAKMLDMVLKEYECDWGQVVGITTDNAANMIKTAKTINENYIKTQNKNSDSESEGLSDESYAEIENTLDQALVLIENNFETSVTCSVKKPEIDLERKVFLENEKHIEKAHKTIFNSRCIAHTLHLAIIDSFKNCSDISMLLEKCRRLVKKLRTPNIISLFKNASVYNFPILDVITRWSSTFKMLERLCDIKSFVIENEQLLFGDLGLSSNEWNDLSQIIESLKIVNDLMMQIQAENIFPSVFYKKWLKCKFILTGKSNEFSKELILNLQRREKFFRENEIFMVNIFLDPQLKYTLNEKEYDKVRETIIALYKNLKDLDKKITEEFEAIAGTSEMNNDFENDFDECFNAYLDSHSNKLPTFNQSRPLIDINAEIIEYYNSPRLKHTVDIIEFWCTLKSKFPALFEVTIVALGLPITQVSVERGFSSLKFILNDLRGRMNSEMLENILLLRENNK